MKDERGFALVITLLITALLVALAVEFVDEVFVDTSARHTYVEAQQAGFLAGSGIEAGTRLLQYGLNGQNYSSLADLDRLASLLHIDDEQGTVQVTFVEESGKLNINAIVNPDGTDNDVYRPIANRLFKKLGLQPDLLDAVADWIDTNSEVRTAGAETSFYQTLKPPYAAKNGNLETFEELRLIKGFDGKIVSLLRPYITVYPDVPGSPTAPVNINTAPRELLAALDDKMTDDLAQQVIVYRKTTPLKSSTDLGNAVAGMGTLSLALASNFRIMGSQEKGAVFRITSQAKVNETIRVVEAVVRFSGQPTILYWREF